jgi:hypothetical protein
VAKTGDWIAGFAIWDETEEEAAFADTGPASTRQMRNTTTRIFIAFNTIRAILSFSVTNGRDYRAEERNSGRGM